jgi:hypothetical protein
LLITLCFAFTFFDMIVIFFWWKLAFINFYPANLVNILDSASWRIFAALFAITVSILWNIFIFKENFFLTFIFSYCYFLFGIRTQITMTLFAVGSITNFIFKFVIHIQINESICFFFSDIKIFYPLNLLYN